jgi:hypothetical protein
MCQLVSLTNITDDPDHYGGAAIPAFRKIGNLVNPENDKINARSYLYPLPKLFSTIP